MSPSQLTRLILPETVLLIFALAVLMGCLFIKSRHILGALTLTGILAAAACLPGLSQTAPGPYLGMLLNDAFGSFFKVTCLFISGIVVLISMGYRSLDERSIGEYYFLLLTGTLAMLLAVASNNLLMIYVALEMLSLICYFLAAFFKNDGYSSEGALKYFLFGALASGIMLYGISLVYGLFGTLDLSAIAAMLSLGQVNTAAAALILVLVLAGLAFKCGFAPFHMWVPDAYQGAPTAVAAFISVGPKAAGFAVLLRIFVSGFSALYIPWTNLIVIISVLTMTLGNVVALSQTNIKRMLGYSSIAQAGYILIGLAAASSLGTQSVLFYVFVYALMNLGAFGCVILVSNSIASDTIEDYAGLYKKDPVTAFLLTVFLLSLAGVPPLAGFLAKFLVFAAAIDSQLIWLAAAGAVNSVIAAFYYIKVIKFMYLHEPVPGPVLRKPPALQLALAITLTLVLAAGLLPHLFLNHI
ncbi:MAG: NADH-quinone oxidoreductase subunit N [Candidatus Omnitrophota bacterium]